jgi:hypothetical protein
MWWIIVGIAWAVGALLAWALIAGSKKLSKQYDLLEHHPNCLLVSGYAAIFGEEVEPGTILSKDVVFLNSGHEFAGGVSFKPKKCWVLKVQNGVFIQHPQKRA